MAPIPTQRFADICKKAFQEKDTNAKWVLDLLANASRGRDGHLRLDKTHQDLFESCGIPVIVENEGMVVSAEHTKQLEDIKNTVRKEVHRNLEMQESSEFEGMIQKLRGASNEMPQTREEADAMLSAVKLYMKNYGGNLVIHPIIEALRNILSQQLKSDVCMQWRLEDSSLTERGDSKFLQDTLNMFSKSGIFISNLYQEDHEDPRFRLWTINPSLSNFRITKMLSCLPRKTEFRATGKVVKSSIKRTNLNGHLDHSTWVEKRCPWFLFSF